MIRYHFDRFGSYLGYVDDTGNYYDLTGTCRGYFEPAGGGDFYTSDGTRGGFVDPVGNFYDDQTIHLGYLR
jgi:hypothetical protein